MFIHTLVMKNVHVCLPIYMTFEELLYFSLYKQCLVHLQVISNTPLNVVPSLQNKQPKKLYKLNCLMKYFSAYITAQVISVSEQFVLISQRSTVCLFSQHRRQVDMFCVIGASDILCTMLHFLSLVNQLSVEIGSP